MRITIIIASEHVADARRLANEQGLDPAEFPVELNAMGSADAATHRSGSWSRVSREQAEAIAAAFAVPWATVGTTRTVGGTWRAANLSVRAVPSNVPPSPPGGQPDLETLATLQHRAAWMPPAVNPPHDYRDYADAAALRAAGVRVPDDGVMRRVTHYGDAVSGRGWLLTETWTAPDGTTWTRRTARRFDGADRQRSHDWRVQL